MEEVKDSIKQNATDMFYNQIVDLQSLVRAIEVTKEKDLQWLLQKTIVYDNPLKKQQEELKRIAAYTYQVDGLGDPALAGDE